MHSKPTYEELLIKIQELEKLEYKRNQTALELKRRYKFEKIIAEISSEFVGIRTESIDKVIDRALSLISTFTEADRAYIFQFKNDTMLMDNTHEWCAVGVEPKIENLKDIPVDEELPWFTGHIRRRDTFHVPDVAALPPEARLEREHFETQNIQSLIVVPMETEERLIGFLGFDSVRNRRTWNDDDKSLLRFFGQTLSHVIERTRVENALKEANTILNRSPAVAFTWKNQEDWPVEFVTENVENVFSYTAKEFLSGKVIYANCIHKDDLERVGNEVKTFSNEKDTTEFNHLPYRIITKDGDIKIVSDWTFINRDDEGNITHYKGIIEDITKRKQAEEALKVSEEQYRILFESSRDAIMTLAPPTWSFTSGNPATVELFRARDETEFISLKPWQLSPERQPDDRLSDEKAKEMIETAMRNGSHFFEWTHCHSDGTPFPAEVLLTRMEQRGQVLLQATVRDITGRKQLEEQRDMLIADLQKILSEVKTLRGFFPICSYCKNIRNDKGYWDKIETYLHKHSDAEFSHGICPECAKKYYPDMDLYGEDESQQ